MNPAVPPTMPNFYGRPRGHEPSDAPFPSCRSSARRSQYYAEAVCQRPPTGCNSIEANLDGDLEISGGKNVDAVRHLTTIEERNTTAAARKR
jgi:hypothetical protein